MEDSKIHHPYKGGLIAFCYGCCSLSMALLNKTVMNTYEFDYPLFLVTFQMLFTTLLLRLLATRGLLSLPYYSLSRARLFLVPSIFYGFHSILSLTALSGMNIPMYGVIKRCSPVVILLLGLVYVNKSRPTLKIILAVCMITSGCIIAGIGDLSYNTEAYVYGAASVFSQAIYMLLVQRMSSSSYTSSGTSPSSSSSSITTLVEKSTAAPLSAVEILHLNSCNILVAMTMLHLTQGGATVFEPATDLFSRHFPESVILVSIVAVLIMAGCLLNYLVFLCSSHNSALTTSIVGTVKSVVQTAVGIFTFGGIAVNAFTVCGISVNLAGGMLYLHCKYAASKNTPTSSLATPLSSSATPIAVKDTFSPVKSSHSSPVHHASV